MSEEKTITLTDAEISLLESVLIQLPYGRVAALIQKIKQQLEAQEEKT